MNRFALIAAAALAPLLAAQPAAAQEWYGKVSLGQSEAAVSGIDLDEGLTYGAALGTALGPLRVEAGVDRASADLSLGPIAIDTDALVYSGTAYLDLPVGANASLFVGAGLDYVDAEASFFGSSIDASGTGYHWAVGGAYRLNDRMIAEAQVRGLTADLSADLIGDVDLDATSYTFGLRFEL